jgi:excisionase family DNA binding protein
MRKPLSRELFSIPRAAEIVGVPERTVREAADRGDLPAEMIGGRYRVVTRADLERWATNRPRKRGRPRKAP